MLTERGAAAHAGVRPALGYVALALCGGVEAREGKPQQQCVSHIYTHTFMHRYIHASIHKYTYIHTYIYTYIYIYINTCMHAYIFWIRISCRPQLEI